MHDIDPRLREDSLRVVVETPRGSRHKYAWNEELRAFELRQTLSSGLAWPYDYGFIPRTKGGDGDALDMLALMDEPTFPGCILTVRLLGAFELEKDGAQNDRYVTSLLPSAETSLSTDGYETLSDLPEQLLNEMETFLTTYSAERGHDVRLRGRLEARAAYERVKASLT